MKQLSTTIALLLACTVYSQQQPCEKTIKESLQQAAEVLNQDDSRKLWNVALNAPIIIIDHMENKMYFTAIDNGKVADFREEQWNDKVPLANSFFEYNGKRYVTIIHAALTNTSCEGRINLLAHEIFHLHQDSLGIGNAISTNYHMDEAKGRALLQIEMNALQQALDGNMPSLHDALYIRAYRQKAYPNNNEDLYELNEGLAEYTEVKLSASDIRAYVKDRLNYNIKRGYTNAFGYFTGSAYATILDDLYPGWKQDKDLNKGMIYLIKKKYPKYDFTIDNTYLNQLLDKYNYARLLSDEKKELESFGDIAVFEELLKPEISKLYIENNGVNFTYNPHDRVIALSNAVLLRNMTLMAEWGQIKVTSGIVRLNDWSAFYLSPPLKVTEGLVEGDDYAIEMNNGWKVVEVDGIYKMVKSK